MINKLTQKSLKTTKWQTKTTTISGMMMMTSILKMVTLELSKAKILQLKNKQLMKNQFKDKDNKLMILKFRASIMKINQISMIIKKSLNMRMKMIIIVDMTVNSKETVDIIVENTKKERSIHLILNLILGNII